MSENTNTTAQSPHEDKPISSMTTEERAARYRARERATPLGQALEKSVAEMTGEELQALLLDTVEKSEEKLRPIISSAVWRGIMIASVIAGLIAAVIWFFGWLLSSMA